jgi:site-specific DNA-methyltransferase (adenine-specific)
MKLSLNEIICGNCEEALKKLPSNSINLIITSPPYSDKRNHTYGGIHPDKYVEWFLPIAEQLLRVLKFDGTFILNIKEGTFDGQKHTYVIELILELKKKGWFWTEEFIWHKKNSFPGKWPNRFRDSWERCLQFNKRKKFQMYQENVMMPVGDWAKVRFKKLSTNDKKRIESQVKSGFGRNVSNWEGRDKVFPTNVLHLATESSNKNHSAVFPITLPTWFIKLFSKEGDLVLDPFVGSGTTALAAKKLNRNFIAIDNNCEYCEIARKRVSKGSL